MTSLFSPEDIDKIRETYGEEALEIFGIADYAYSGYYKYPNGKIKCWGVVEPDGSIVFPISFNISPMIVLEGQRDAICQLSVASAQTTNRTMARYVAWGV